MHKNGFTKVELLVFLGIFTIAYFIIANKVSYSFTGDTEQEMYAVTINSIEKQSVLYGQNNEDLFKEKTSIYVTVEELIKKGYYTADDSEGNVEDPRDNTKNLNDVKIKITNKNNKVTAKVLG